MSAALFTPLVICLLAGLPVALAMAIAALTGLILVTPLPPLVVVQRFFTAMDSFPLMAIPFFMLGGLLMERGGISRRLIDFVYLLLGKLSGGLAMVTIWTSCFFGALTGSSVATVAAVGGLMIPAMIKEGYEEGFAVTTAATSGFLGPIIPPSIIFVTFGVATNVSIGALFLAGVLPGILLAFCMSSYAYYVGRKNGYRIKDDQKITAKQLFHATQEASYALLMPVIILGGIYGGFVTPTEAACVALLYALFLGLFIYKEVTWKELPGIFKRAAVSSALVMFIVACATSFGYLMAREKIPMQIASSIVAVTSDPVVFLLIVNGLLLVLGTFMETNAGIMLTAPILMPIALALKIDPILFGAMFCINLCIGMITPPLGVNLFVAAGVHGCPMSTIINRHLMCYFLVSIIALLMITFIPAISLTLPNMLR